jgi:hypothetical protein
MISCNQITFDRPQPESVNILTSIPKKLVGNYISKDGSSKLTIDPAGIYCTYEYEVVCHKDSAMNGEFSNPPIKIEGDYLYYLVNFTDTILWLSNDNVLKKDKGYYFLNKKIDENSWSVSKLKLKKGILTIARISTKEELELLEEINESPIDSTTFNISFTRKQFKKFVDSDSFTKVDTFLRVK